MFRACNLLFSSSLSDLGAAPPSFFAMEGRERLWFEACMLLLVELEEVFELLNMSGETTELFMEEEVLGSFGVMKPPENEEEEVVRL